LARKALRPPRIEKNSEEEELHAVKRSELDEHAEYAAIAPPNAPKFIEIPTNDLQNASHSMSAKKQSAVPVP
jgi:hypothetical protein